MGDCENYRLKSSKSSSHPDMCRMSTTELLDNLFNRGDYKNNKIQKV